MKAGWKNYPALLVSFIRPLWKIVWGVIIFHEISLIQQTIWHQQSLRSPLNRPPLRSRPLKTFGTPSSLVPFPVILDQSNKSQGIRLRFPSRILLIVSGAIGPRFSLARKPYRRFLRPSGKKRNLTACAKNYSLLLRIASPCNSGMNTKMPKTVISGNAATDWKIGLSIKMAKWKKGWCLEMIYF